MKDVKKETCSMTKQDVIKSLEKFFEKFPAEALRAVSENISDYLPELLESLEYIGQNAVVLYEEDSDYFLHIYAMFLLAQFREKRAFPYLIAFLRLPEDLCDYVLGDSLTEDIHRMLLCTYDGDLPMLCSVIEDQQLHEWARNAAIRAYELLYSEGFVSREEFVGYLRELIRDKLPLDDSEVVFTALVGSVADYSLSEMIPDVRFLYDNDCVDEFVYGRYDGFIDSLYMEIRTEAKNYIDDALSEIEGWSCFGQSDSEKGLEHFGEDLSKLISDGIREDMDREQAPKQKQIKTGRNEPCPCGSGKKYKKCCYDSHRSGDQAVASGQVVRLEDKHDLLEYYPKKSSLFKSEYGDEAIEVDMLVYKALAHRAIPMWVKRDHEQERIGKINYLHEALRLFVDKCEREDITSFAAYDEQHMVHYRSSEWVSELINLIESRDTYDVKKIRSAAKDIFHRFKS